jgi:hypothetical protein
LSYFFFLLLLLRLQSISFSSKTQIPQKFNTKFRTFFFKFFFYTETREGDCYGGVGGSSAGPELRENVCLPTNKRRRWRQRQDGAGVIFVAKSGDDPTINI